jgi:glutamate--cysteine ligase
MPAPEYARKGVYEDGEWLQLNGNILQIENEFYSFMRPKRPSKKPNQPPSFALKEEGVQYVELRAMDVNPFELTGMTDSSLFFAELMCLWCLFLPSPPITQWDQMEISKNQRNVASYGQNKELALAVSGELIGLRQWASSILESMAPLAEALDRESGSDSYTKSLSAQMDKVQNKSLTLASRVLNVMRKEQWSHTDFGMAYAEKYKTKLDSMEVSQETQEWWQNVVKESWDAQKQLEEQEKAENVDFNTFLHAYMSQYDKYEEQ